MTRPSITNKIILFFVASAVALLAAYLFWSFAPEVKILLEHYYAEPIKPDEE